MKKLIGALFSIALALAVALPAAAATQGGKLVYARYADSLLLDPVFNDANVDIWILTNLYDTLFLPTDDGKDVQPGLATAWQAADDGMTYTITLRAGRQVRRRHADDRRRRQMVARPRRQSRRTASGTSCWPRSTASPSARPTPSRSS